MGTILKTAVAPLSSHRPSLPVRLPGAGGVLAGIVGLMVTWEQRLKDRDTLRAMTAAQLGDIGLDAATAARAATKPFWRA